MPPLRPLRRLLSTSSSTSSSPTTTSLDARSAAATLPTYGLEGVRTRKDLAFRSGRGAVLVSTKGEEFIDMSSGIAVNILGHADPEWQKAIRDQIAQLAHVSNLFHSAPYVELSERLLKNSPGFARVFLCNSGTEANEGALKFARLRYHVNEDGETDASKRSRVIAFKSSFHGRTLGALSATYKPAIRAPFAPLLHSNVDFVEYNDLRAVEERMAEDVMAVIVEPVQGEGGVNPAKPEFLHGLRKLCDAYGSTLIYDEIQVGLGRGGHFWGHQAYCNCKTPQQCETCAVRPHIMTAAKPLAGGLPIGAVLVSNEFKTTIPDSKWPGTHGTTFGGNAVVCAAALSVLARLEDPAFMANARASGRRLITGLVALQKKYPDKVKQVRRPIGDQALFAGVQLSSPSASAVVQAALEKHAVFITAGDYGDTIRICPPLIMTPEQVDKGLEALDYALGVTKFTSTTTTASPTTMTTSATTSVSSPTGKPSFNSLEEYRAHIEKTCPLPPGFRVGADKLTFSPKELPAEAGKSFPMRLSVIALEPGKVTENYAAVFTRNAFPGAPITVGKEIVKSNAKIAGVLVNNKISNVSPRGDGVADAKRLCDAAVKALGFENRRDVRVLPASTGVIGWSLPVPEMLACIPRVTSSLSSSSSALVAAEAIMTTDRYPKARSRVVPLEGGKRAGRITGVAKGAGMIEPNMATMLVYIMTDVAVPRERLQKVLAVAVNAPGSFNRITVDSDQSTSDMCFAMSSNLAPLSSEEAQREKDIEAFAGALKEVCAELAEDIVRNGEGTRHVLRVEVVGAPNEELARGCGMAIANSPLVKTAIFGNDPNVGRVVAALGSYLGRQRSLFVARKIPQRTVVKVGGTVVFEKGAFALDPEKEKILSQMMRESEMNFSRGEFPPHFKCVDVKVELNSGEARTVVIGSDLSEDYVKVNADYRS